MARSAILSAMDLVERKDTSSKRHPWEVARAEFFLRLLAEDGILETARAWLDVGSGDAWLAGQLLRLLPPASTVTCWDVNYALEDLASVNSSEGITLVADRPEVRFDRILMLDVIEHVEDDAGFIASTVGDLLAGGGIVLVSVPAYQGLFSSHDVELRHCRRYSPAGCRRLLERSGLDVLRDGGLFLSLLPIRAGQMLLERVRPLKSLSGGIGGWQGGTVATLALTRALVADGELSLRLNRQGLSLPGLSYWALCRSRRPG